MGSLREVRITAVFLNNEDRILIHFPPDPQLEKLVCQLPGCSWSDSFNGWHIRNNPANLRLIFRTFRGIASIDKSGVFGPKSVAQKIIKDATAKRNKIPHPSSISEAPSRKIEEFHLWLMQQRYSENTIKTYVDGISTFLRYYAGKKPEEITNKDLVDFNNDYILKKGYSVSFQNQVINAVKLFFLKVENRNINIEQIERPRREHKLPDILSKEEIGTMLKATENIKHKCLIALIYSCGLRRSETINIKLADIDSKRMLIKVRNAKGRKDRYVQLSVHLLSLLRDYYKEFKPKEYLFEGQNGAPSYSGESIVKVIKSAAFKAGIRKRVYPHILRHSFATHHLEQGTDLRFIQELLGHASVKTTERYTHVANNAISKLKNPMDELFEDCS